MYRTALLGRDIGYTQSPSVHAAIAETLGIELSFDVYDVPYDRLDGAVEKLFAEYDGFFVTKPYKTELARRMACDLDAVNVVRTRDRSAHNTDGSGFIRALDINFPDWKSEVNSALVLGAGGAARAAVGALDGLGKDVYVLNRTLMNAVRLTSDYPHAQLYVNQPVQLAVNCTSLGRSGEDVLSALCVLPDFKYALDMNYGCGVTPFMRRSRNAGAAVADGADMLIFQAIEGDKIITSADFDVTAVYARVAEILKGRKN